jgi:UDP-N-acetylmuramoyl-tripeptide--D-alanyl-D-alanine ligase
MMMRLEELRDVLGAEVRGPAVGSFEQVGSDSRAVTPGMLFVALRGERFDAHDFVADALAAGAVAALVDRAGAARLADVADPLVIVDDTRTALSALAAHWRSRFDIPVIGVTGSNGKTTVKEMCASILCAAFGQEAVLATRGNLNNDIGLPLTLLGLRAHHRAAVIEMGMNNPGEISALVAVGRPTVAIVTNAQRAHLLGMGTLDEVAREKGSIYTAGSPEAVAVINADDAHADYWRHLVAGRRALAFGLEHDADVRGRAVMHGLGARLDIESFAGRASIVLAVPGLHNVRNALGAAAACLAAGVGLAAVIAGLEAYRGTKGRLQKHAGPRGSLLIDDSYNANPDSVRAAIDVLAATPGDRVLVLGDMGEVGETSAQVHDEVGGYAKSKGVEALYALGEMSALAARNFGDGGQHFPTVEALLGALLPRIGPDSVVLVKGSRFMRMERVVEALIAAREAGAQGDNDAA